MPDLHSLVQRMVEGGESEDDIKSVIQHYPGGGGLYDPQRKPVSAEDFAPIKTSPAREKAKGVLKGVTSSLAGLGELAVNAGLIPGVAPAAFDPALRNPVFRAAEEATTATNTDQRIGKGLETAAELAVPAYDVAKLGVTAARAAPALVGKAGPLAADLITEALPFGRVARKVLGHVLDAAATKEPAVANVGGRLVRAGERPAVEDEIAKALDELRTPARPESVELPPPAELPPGYEPRTSAPEPVAPANAGGRLVAPGATPTTEQALADVLAKARVVEPPARITTPPEPTLPPGYTPRTTVPRPKAVKAELPKPVQEAIAAGEKKRAYFLKPAEQVAEEAAAETSAPSATRPYFLRSPDEMAAIADAAKAPKVKPSGTITQEDLPASWQNHTGQDIFPVTGEEGKAVASALADELKARGMSPGQAMALVSKNKAIPVQVRTQLLRALNKAGAR